MPHRDPYPRPDLDATTLAEEQVSEDLLLRFQLGDRTAFEAIVGRYQAPLTRFFYRLCWDQDRAEDFAQDVFLKLLRGAPNYRPRGRLSTFLFRIATNRWIDHYRAQRPRPALYSLDRSDMDDDTPILDRVPAEEAPASQVLDRDEEKQRLRRALSRLTLPHRLVFELAVYQNLPYREIADLLEIPEGTVKSRMHNAAKSLKQLLAAPQDGECRGPGGGSGGPCMDRRA